MADYEIAYTVAGEVHKIAYSGVSLLIRDQQAGVRTFHVDVMKRMHKNVYDTKGEEEVVFSCSAEYVKRLGMN